MENNDNILVINKIPKAKKFIPIIFDPNTTPQLEEPLLNGYGLDLTHPEFIKYKKDNLEAEVIGGVNLMVLNRFQVMLKISKRPQLSVQDVYRNNVDLYNESNMHHFVKQASIKLKIDSVKISDFIYDLTERLETYRKDRRSYTEETPIFKTTNKEEKKLKELLNSETLLEDVQGLLGEAGLPCSRTGLQLFLIALSSKQTNVMHGILQGDGELCSEVIRTISNVLPVEISRYKTSISDNVMYYAPSENYWKNKVLLLPTIDTLSKKNTALTELILQGRVSRLVTENTEQGTYRASNKTINGDLSFISSTTKGYHELMASDNVMLLPLTNTNSIKESIITSQIKGFAGHLDERTIQNSQKKIQGLIREIKSFKVVNPFLEQLDVSKYFNNDGKLITQFLRITNLITLLHQKQVEHTISGGVYQIEVQSKHMLQALELFREIWFKDEKELSFNVASMLTRIKKSLLEDFPENHKETDFLVKDMRAKLEVRPSSFARHINTLYDYGKLERTGGNKKDGFTYKISSWNDLKSHTDQYEEFKNEIVSL